ncbi:MAG: metal-sulfur cluster assembly factor [Actinomycetota bacterium]|nr:metal-sulfur cluster assembly factor [Actinomycetota bacterium]
MAAGCRAPGHWPWRRAIRLRGARAAAARCGVMGGTAGSAFPDQAEPAAADLALACAVNAAWNALTYVCDPELGLDVVSLGLVYGVHAREGAVAVEMTLTRPGGLAAEDLPEMAKTAVAGAVGGREAEVRVVWDPPWDPSMIDQIAAAAAGLRIGSR